MVSPFLAEELYSSMEMTLPPNRCIADEKLHEVRVLTYLCKSSRLTTP